jgi:dihydroorotase
MSKTLIRGARILGGEPRDVLLDGETVAAVGNGLSAGGATVIEAAGMVLLPGLVDLHTHLREPGREDSETVLTGTRAAAVGGYTAVHAMANTFPVADTAGVVEQVWRLGKESGYCDVQPVGAVTVGLEGKQLAELGAMADSAAQVRVFSDDGKCVDDAVIMRRALEYVKAFDGVVAQHAQEPRLTEGAQMNEGTVSGELGLTGWPAVAEESIIARDVLLAAHVGSRVHICHLSTAGSVEIVRWAKSKGWDVTAEVTPHHLLLTDELVRSYNPVYKVNPPLRTEADVLALREALADGTIDCVATDHAPHPHEDKDCEWAAAAMGMVGLETALSVVQHTMVDTGLLDWAGVADRMSARPAVIGRLAGHGRPIAAGEPANLALVDPAYRGTVNPAGFASRSRNTPYEGRELPGTVVATFLRGHATVMDGKLT